MIIEILATMMGIVMSLGYYPQAYKIIKNKSTKNISKISYWIFGIGTIIWLIYGIIIKSWVVILSFGIGVIGSWSVLILSYMYSSKKK